MLIASLVVGVVLIILVVFVITIYNGLVAKRVDCDNGWSQIDVQLTRRHDLIPNLVETVKGFASHEKETLDAVISARAKAVATHDDAGAGPGQMGLAEGMLSSALGRLMAVAEAYPDIKANTNFLSLQEELSSTENKISFARQHYNDTVARYEMSRQQFPSNIIAGLFGFALREYFNIEEESVRRAPSVSFN